MTSAGISGPARLVQAQAYRGGVRVIPSACRAAPRCHPMQYLEHGTTTVVARLKPLRALPVGSHRDRSDTLNRGIDIGPYSTELAEQHEEESCLANIVEGVISTYEQFRQRPARSVTTKPQQCPSSARGNCVNSNCFGHPFRLRPLVGRPRVIRAVIRVSGWRPCRLHSNADVRRVGSIQ